MNVFTLRKKLKSVQSVEPEAMQVVAPAPLPAVAVQPVLEPLPERIGLDDIFGMTDSDLNRISPKHTFGALKKPAVAPTMGLNALLMMED